MGHHLSPPPKAVILVYGIVDPAAAWPILALVPENSGDAPPWVGEFSDTELEEFLKDRNESNILTDALWADENNTASEQALSRQWGTDIRRIRLQEELRQWRSDKTARIGSTVRSVRLGSLHAERFTDEAALTAFLLSM